MHYLEQLALEIRKKRITFTLAFIAITVGFYLVNWQLGEIGATENVQQAVFLLGRLFVVGLYLWFGYAMGINKQTVWFMGMLAILPIASWLGLLYLLYKSGQMQLEAKKGSKPEKNEEPLNNNIHLHTHNHSHIHIENKTEKGKKGGRKNKR